MQNEEQIKRIVESLAGEWVNDRVPAAVVDFAQDVYARLALLEKHPGPDSVDDALYGQILDWVESWYPGVTGRMDQKDRKALKAILRGYWKEKNVE